VCSSDLIAALGHFVSNNPDIVDLYVFRSYANYVWEWLLQTAHEDTGLGLFQGVEFVLTRRWTEQLALAGVAWSRLRASMKLLSRSRVYRVSLGRDRALNARTLLELAKSDASDRV